VGCWIQVRLGNDDAVVLEAIRQRRLVLRGYNEAVVQLQGDQGPDSLRICCSVTQMVERPGLNAELPKIRRRNEIYVYHHDQVSLGDVHRKVSQGVDRVSGNPKWS
jgi:hypothetical protein